MQEIKIQRCAKTYTQVITAVDFIYNTDESRGYTASFKEQGHKNTRYLTGRNVNLYEYARGTRKLVRVMHSIELTPKP